MKNRKEAINELMKIQEFKKKDFKIILIRKGKYFEGIKMKKEISEEEFHLLGDQKAVIEFV